MCSSVKPEAPVVTIVIEKPAQIAESLTIHPVRIEFKVSFTCELATTLHVASHVLYTGNSRV